MSMTLKVIAANQTVLEQYNSAGVCIQKLFFSYETIVAAWTEKSGFLRTATRHSHTTETHIAAWLKHHQAECVDRIPQDMLDCLIG